MAILYVFKVNDPNGVGPVPPTVASSAWFTGLQEYFQKNQIASNPGVSDVCLFANESELNAFISAHTLTDASLLADVSAWKSAHDVSYSHQYYTLTNAGISPTPFIS